MIALTVPVWVAGVDDARVGGFAVWDRVDHKRSELACGVGDFDVMGVNAADCGDSQCCNLRDR